MRTYHTPRAIVGIGAILTALLLLTSCVPDIIRKEPNTSALPASFTTEADTVSTGALSWREYYDDTNLVALIDSALQNNQELNIVMQEIRMAQNEVLTRQGEYLPDVDVGVTGGVDKVSRYTRNGAVEESLEAAPGEPFTDPFTDMGVGASVSWEVDIWKKLRNATEAASLRYLATIEGTNYMVTNLVAEIATNYYELMAMDNMLDAIDATIMIQKSALDIVEQQKQAARATELAVRKFQAEVLKNESRRFTLQQKIVEVENRINYLVGRYPQPVRRSSAAFLQTLPDTLHSGLPAQLLTHRPDIRQAELEMKAADLDVDVARARFYPTLNITAGAGMQAFNPRYFVTTPESMLYNLAGDLMMPVINRKAITAAYYSANARQIQTVFDYERTILNAYIEVENQVAKVQNTRNALDRKSQQVDALIASVEIANSLYMSARADYMEVLMTQRDMLEARMQLIETKVEQMRAVVNIYQALGGGWQ